MCGIAPRKQGEHGFVFCPGSGHADKVVTARAEAYERVCSMPTWNLTYSEGKGGGQLEDIYRETIYEMFGRD